MKADVMGRSSLVSARRIDARDIEVGKRVRARRLVLGMSQTDLAEKVGITFQQVQKYEKGVNRIGASRLERTSEALGVPVAFFFDEGSLTGKAKGVPSNSATVLGSMKDNEVLRILKAFHTMKSRRGRRILVDLAELLAN